MTTTGTSQTAVSITDVRTISIYTTTYSTLINGTLTNTVTAVTTACTDIYTTATDAEYLPDGFATTEVTVYSDAYSTASDIFFVTEDNKLSTTVFTDVYTNTTAITTVTETVAPSPAAVSTSTLTEVSAFHKRGIVVTAQECLAYSSSYPSANSTIASTAIPTYAMACLDTAQYASACQCISAPPITITAPPSTITTATTVTQIATTPYATIVTSTEIDTSTAIFASTKTLQSTLEIGTFEKTTSYATFASTKLSLPRYQ